MPDTYPHSQPSRQEFLRNLTITLVINLTITLVIFSVLGFHHFWLVFLAANSIGISCFLVSWFSMVWIFRQPPCESLALTLGVQPLGALIGSLLAHPFLQAHQPYLQTLAMALVFALPSGLVVYLISRLTVSRLHAKELEAEEARARQRATAMELKTLQNQIEPHFLFNTLANVSALIDLDPVRARKLIGRYSEFLRSSMRVSGVESWSLKEELEMVENYLSIQQMRFPAVSFQIDLPSCWMSQMIPPLLIQPLVENAYEHGLKAVGHAGLISISVRVETEEQPVESYLVIDVVDSGPGLSGDAPFYTPSKNTSSNTSSNGVAATAAKESSNTKGNGIALNNIRARLAHVFGPTASLQVENRHDGVSGVVARVRLPLALQSSQSITSKSRNTANSSASSDSLSGFREESSHE